MTVLHVATGTDRRGGEVFAHDLTSALLARGRDVDLVALQPGTGTARLPITPLGTGRLDVRTIRALRTAAARARVVVGHGSRTLPALAAATVGLRVTFVYRNLGEPLYWSDTALKRARTRWLLTRADRVVALWDGSARTLRERFGVPGDKVRVIPNAVPKERCRALSDDDRAGIRSGLGIDPEAALAVYVGSLAPEKNVGDAIRAIAAIPEATLLVVGDGPERQRLQDLADALAAGRVVFAGSTDRPIPMVAAADALVLPSRSEGIPGVLIEAGLCGIPAIATAVGGVPEVVIDGQTGYLVPPGDVPTLQAKLTRALFSPNGLGDRARAHCAARFEMAPVAAAWDDFLGELGAWDR